MSQKDMCCICLEPLDNAAVLQACLPACTHRIHTGCLAALILRTAMDASEFIETEQAHGACPLCRAMYPISTKSIAQFGTVLLNYKALKISLEGIDALVQARVPPLADKIRNFLSLPRAHRETIRASVLCAKPESESTPGDCGIDFTSWPSLEQIDLIQPGDTEQRAAMLLAGEVLLLREFWDNAFFGLANTIRLCASLHECKVAALQISDEVLSILCDVDPEEYGPMLYLQDGAQRVLDLSSQLMALIISLTPFDIMRVPGQKSKLVDLGNHQHHLAARDMCQLCQQTLSTLAQIEEAIVHVLPLVQLARQLRKQPLFATAAALLTCADDCATQPPTLAVPVQPVSDQDSAQTST